MDPTPQKKRQTITYIKTLTDIRHSKACASINQATRQQMQQPILNSSNQNNMHFPPNIWKDCFKPKDGFNKIWVELYPICIVLLEYTFSGWRLRHSLTRWFTRGNRDSSLFSFFNFVWFFIRVSRTPSFVLYVTVYQSLHCGMVFTNPKWFAFARVIFVTSFLKKINISKVTD